MGLIKFLFGSLKKIESSLYLIRDSFWEYPDLILEDNPRRRKLIITYSSTAPYSHFLLSSTVFIFLSIILFLTGIPNILSSNDKILFEGVVMGSDASGQVQKITKINPLLPSNIQLEKDLVNLIYDPLLKFEYEFKEDGKAIGAVEYVLVDDAITMKPGADYIFNLRQDVFWHDSSQSNPRKFSAEDVITTFDILSKLDANNSSTIALQQLRWERIDDYKIRICTKVSADSTTTCAESNNNPIFSNFLELLSFKIIPEHHSQDIDLNSIVRGQPNLFKAPVGTGKYRLDDVSENSISLALFKQHYGLNEKSNKIDGIRFVYFKNLESAVFALENGEVHTLATSSIEFSNRIKDYTQISQYVSPAIYTQFWGLYFNLRKRPDGTSIGPEFLQDVNVRKAISLAVNRDHIVNDVLKGAAEETYSSIPSISYFFNSNARFPNYYRKIDFSELSAESKDLAINILFEDLKNQKVLKDLDVIDPKLKILFTSFLTSNGFDANKLSNEFMKYITYTLENHARIQVPYDTEKKIYEGLDRMDEFNELFKDPLTLKEYFGDIIDYDSPQITRSTLSFSRNVQNDLNEIISGQTIEDPAQILDAAGWTIKASDQYRTNSSGERLSFSLYFVENFDRRLVAESIKSDLEKIGIDVKINRKDQPGQENSSSDVWSLEELNNIVVAPRSFDVLMYGMDTFIDPDRYELYHSTQIDNLGLNISGYKGIEESVEVNPNRSEGASSIIRVPKVDKFLAQARSYNPETARKERKERYDEIQDLIAKDIPVAYLYHPKFIYYANKAVFKIQFGSLASIEERFEQIDEWAIR